MKGPPAAAASVLALGGLLFLHLPGWLTAVILAAIFIWAADRLGTFVAPEADRVSRAVLGGLAATAVFIVILSAAYYAWKITPLVVFLAASSTLAAAAFAPSSRPSGTRPLSRRLDWTAFLTAAFVIGDACLIASFLAARTDEALRSPWEAVPPIFVALFAALTWLLLVIVRERPGRLSAVLTSIHLFAAYGLVEMVYAYGFGFDPFIHRTAEEYVSRHGIILPKQPYYVGQYVLVTALTWLTRLPVDFIDRWLVPLSAAASLPWVTRFGLKEGWGFSGKEAAFWSLGPLLLPMLPLTFTTPNNLAVLFLIWTVMLAPAALRSRFSPVAAALIVLSALLIHPLIGSAAFSLALGVLLLLRTGNRALAAASVFLTGASATPLMFAANNLRAGAAPFLSGNPFSRWEQFAGIFRSPYLTGGGTTSAVWGALYAYESAVPLLIALGAAAGAYFLWRSGRSGPVVIYAGTALGMLSAVFILSTCVSIENIISYEQLEFALRLKSAIDIVLLPLFLVGLARIFGRSAQGTLTLPRALGLLAAAAFMAVSWYLTYPQANAAAQRSGWGVSRADFDAARLITRLAEGRRYVVLSDQMLSVAALRLNGFEGFSYALPTGAKLYEYFIIMAFYRPERAVMREAMAFAGVPLAFFAYHSYYPGYDALVQRLAGLADDTHFVDGGCVVVFTFTRDGVQ